jgi:hypothetical protein
MTDKKNKPPFYLIDTDADFYRPLGVRLAICVAVVCWAGLEIWNGDGFWGIISGAAALYCIYVLFLSYNPAPKQEPVTRPEEPDEDDAGAEDGSDNTGDKA